ALTATFIMAFGAWRTNVMAGQKNDPNDCGCRSDNRGGGGFFWGTLQSFPAKPHPDALAGMDAEDTSWYQQGNLYACVVKKEYWCWVGDQGRLPKTLSTIGGLGARNGFWVWWDSSQVCHQVYVGHDSRDVE